MTPDEFLALPPQQQAKLIAAAITPEQHARDSAIAERAEYWGRVRGQVRDELWQLREARGDGLSVISLIVQLRALDELQAMALGVPEPSWRDTIAVCGIGAAGVEVIRNLFLKLEATN
jgi:hypothetical protein